MSDEPLLDTARDDAAVSYFVALAGDATPGSRIKGCEEAQALAKLLTTYGLTGLATKVIFWHTDGEYEHDDQAHTDLRPMQRDGDLDYKNPGAWTRAREIATR